MSFKRNYHSIADLPAVIPVFPLGRALLFPRGELPLNIIEPRYVAMVDAALAGLRIIGMVQPSGETDDRRPALARVGCIGRITQLAEMSDGRYHIELTGICRFGIAGELDVATPYRQCHVDYQDFSADLTADPAESQVNRVGVVAALREFVDVHNLHVDWESIDLASTEALVNGLSMLAPFSVREKQALLEAPDLPLRAEMLIAFSQMGLARHGSGSSTLQ
ncbi:MAG: LON peptidase substrate-binding domain-containing protein [Hyphomicrobiales bacterium]|nr:LON peptidase substrate-binding domain-containing protein [Hyphomicrobiales bacterium]